MSANEERLWKLAERLALVDVRLATV